MITNRFADWITGSEVSLQPDTDIHKLVSNGTGYGTGYLKRVYRYF